MTTSAQSVSYVKAHLAQCIDQVREGGGPLIITQNGATAAVLQDAESYERTQQALLMMKLVAMADKNVRDGKVHTVDAVFAEARKRAAAIRKDAKSRKSGR
jgi:prevent-host-death family protein